MLENVKISCTEEVITIVNKADIYFLCSFSLWHKGMKKVIRDIVKRAEPKGTYYAILTSLVLCILMLGEMHE
jgi:hypothetical protein